MSLPVRGAWIEIVDVPDLGIGTQGSLPVRGAWIEILKTTVTSQFTAVAPRKGSVD